MGAKRSAIIPLFRTAISDAKVILFYREQHDPQRPFRAIRLKNQTTHSLGRGICEVSVDGDFQGKCVLEPTKTGDEVLLVYAKETGVRVFKKKSRPESRRMASQDFRRNRLPREELPPAETSTVFRAASLTRSLWRSNIPAITATPS